jgi:formylglycine-generating enzyme required for sulfatase activity
MPPFKYDVFLSHNSADKPFVEEIANRLKEHKLRPFLDRWNLVPGDAWQPELEVAMRSCATAAIVFGATGDGPWHNAEMQVLLNRAQRERGEFRLIPVLLEGADPTKIGSFLELRTWVDFGKDPFDVALKRLIAGIKGEPPEDGSGYNLPDEPAPYRSLRRFEARHADYFFGRDPDIEKLVQRLARQRFVAVVGASGSGKSSLVRAGLATTLAREKLPALAEWRTLTVIPGSRPLHELARAYLKTLDVSDADLPNRLDDQVARFRENDRAFVDSLLDQGGVWLVVVDQLEEVFTQTRGTAGESGSSPDEAERLTAVLARAVELSGERIRVLVTLRADFLHRCLDFSALKDLLQDNQLLLGRLEDTGLREAIVRPAGKVGALFEKGLVERIVSDVRGESGSLPLLQHALYELWLQRRGVWLTNASYDATGGVAGALRKRADETFNGLTERQQQIARNIFVRLTTLGEGVSDTRRRATRSELRLSGFERAEVDDVLRLLSSDQARLIEASADTVEVTHEALIQQWPTLRKWLDTNRAELRLHRQLTEAANEWASSHANPALRDVSRLYRGRRLADAKAWADRNGGALNDLEREFLNAGSRAARWRRNRVIAGAVLFLALALVGTLSAMKSIAEEEVETLVNAEPSNVPEIVERIKRYRFLADPLLRKKWAEGKENARRRAALALLPRDGRQIDCLYDQLLRVEPAEFVIVRDALYPQRQEITERLWKAATESERPIASRFQAACALATYDPDGTRWATIGESVAEHLLTLDASALVAWRTALRPARKKLVGPLETVYRDPAAPPLARQYATETLADYGDDDDDPQRLFDLLADAELIQFPVIYRKVKDHHQRARFMELARAELKKPADDEMRARRQANMAIALLKMGEARHVWKLLKRSPNPQARSNVIHWLDPLGVEPRTLIQRFGEEADVTVRQALLLALGQFEATQVPSDERDRFINNNVEDAYRTAVDRGFHAAAEWLLGKWGETEKIKTAVEELREDEQKLRSRPQTDRRQWYINSQGQTFVILQPHEFQMGSPPEERGHQENEVLRTRRISHTLAIAAKEVTRAQYQEFLNANPPPQPPSIEEALKLAEDVKESKRRLGKYSKTRDSPQLGLTWYAAARYCNWLSKIEGLSEEEWCYEPNKCAKFAEGMRPAQGYLQRKGYRLPTEEEWEFACRAGVVTSRYYGSSDALLPEYAWFRENSKGNFSSPVGWLKPNDFGLFDVLGNVWEWCDDAYGSYPVADRGADVNSAGGTKAVLDRQNRVLRGAAFSDPASEVRSAYRDQNRPGSIAYIGVRPARTYR